MVVAGDSAGKCRCPADDDVGGSDGVKLLARRRLLLTDRRGETSSGVRTPGDER